MICLSMKSYYCFSSRWMCFSRSSILFDIQHYALATFGNSSAVLKRLIFVYTVANNRQAKVEAKPEVLTVGVDLLCYVNLT